MNVTFLQSEPAQSLAWTLLHFIWQGTGLALALKLTLTVLRQSSAQARYLVSCGALVVAALCPPLTFAVLHQAGSSLERTSAVTGPNLEAAQAGGARLVSDSVLIRVAAPDGLVSPWVEGSLPWVLLVWAGGVLVCSVRLAAGCYHVRRLARGATPLGQCEWLERLHLAGRRLGLTRPVILVQSALVNVPAALGYFRPCILLPMTGLTGLTPAEVEAILAHELAHVLRRDYLVNLLQSLVETLLFYHPAVWWISRQIRDEREAACDDLVVAAYGDAVGYSRALLKLEEGCQAAPAALAVSARGGSLLKRVQRLLGKPVPQSSWGGSIISLAVPAALALGLLAVDSIPAVGVNRRPPAPVSFAALPNAQGFEAEGGAEERGATDTEQPQVAIEVKFVAPTEAELKKCGLDWLLGGGASTGARESYALQITNRNGIISPPALDEKGQPVGELFDNPGLRNLEIVNPGVARILTESQFRGAIRALEQRSKADLMAAPGVTTLSGRRARIEVVDLKQIVTGVSVSTDAQNRTRVNYLPIGLPSGPTVEVLPKVSADRKGVRLSLKITWTEFLGYDEPRPFAVPVADGVKSSQALQVQRPLPHFQARQASATLDVPDEETIAISGFGALSKSGARAGSSQGKVFRTRSNIEGQLIVFVTPVVSGSSGKPERAAPQSNGVFPGQIPGPSADSPAPIVSEWAKVKIDANGVVFVKGKKLTIDELSTECVRLKKVGGAIVLFVEIPYAVANAAQFEVVRKIVEAGVPMKAASTESELD